MTKDRGLEFLNRLAREGRTAVFAAEIQAIAQVTMHGTPPLTASGLG